MWSVCVVTVVNSIKRQYSNNELEDGYTNEQEESSSNEEGPVTGEKSPQLKEQHSSSREIQHLMLKA